MTITDNKHQDEKDSDATQSEESDDGGREHSILSASPLIWILLVAAAGWAVWSTATKGSGKPTPVRAVVVPTSGPKRTIAVLPCAAVAPTSSSQSSGAAKGLDSVVLPSGSGLRVVLVPSCGSSGSGGASGGSSAKGGAAIVLPPGEQQPAPGDTLPLGGSGSGASGAKAKVGEVYRVPESSRATTVVVVPCQGKKKGGSSKASAQPGVPESGSGLAMAPPCSAGSSK